jgi:type II protein arginine methyltransferase
VDAMDSPVSPDNQDAPPFDSAEAIGVESGVVKIGQTSLHNPGGRSSWIGL